MNFRPGLIAAAAGFVLSLGIGLIAGAGIFAVVRALVFAAFFFVLVSGLRIAVARFLPELLEIANSGAAYAGYGAAGHGDAGNGDAGDNEGEAAGSRVNIAVEGDVSPPVFGGGASGRAAGEGLFSSASAGENDDDDDFDPDEPIPSPALDQFNEDEYTESGDFAAPASLTVPPNMATPSRAAAGSGAFMPGLPGVPGTASVPEPGGGVSPARRERAGDGESVDMLPDLEAMSQAFLASTQEAEQSGFDGGGGGSGNPFEGGGKRGYVGGNL